LSETHNRRGSKGGRRGREKKKGKKGKERRRSSPMAAVEETLGSIDDRFRGWRGGEMKKAGGKKRRGGLR